MSELNVSSIRKELRAIRDHMGTLGELTGPFAKSHSKWSAHARWSSSSSRLAGEFSIETRLGLPDKPDQLDKLIIDSGSERLMAVVRELTDICGTPPKPEPRPKS